MKKPRPLKYYDDEDNRIRDLNERTCNKREARALVKDLSSRFNLKPISVEVWSGDSYYMRADQYLLLGDLTIGTLIHEFAHYWDHMRGYLPLKVSPSKLIRTLSRKRVKVHCKRHADLVDILAEYVRAKH